MTTARTSVEGTELGGLVDWTVECKDQSIWGELVASRHTPKLRASIRRNAYDFQSSAVLKAWTEAGWTPILETPIDLTRVFDRSYVEWNMAGRREAIVDAMVADLLELYAKGVKFFAGEEQR